MKLLYYIIGVIILIVIISVAVFDHIYHNPADDWTYCKRNKPAWNNTGERSDICFTELWGQYCKIRAPQACNSIPDWLKKIT